VLACPGPGEHETVLRAVPGTLLLPHTDLGTFGALLSMARVVVANDSGPGHLAAAVGARLISVFGVTQVEKTRPLGPNVQVVGGNAGWPGYDEVRAAVFSALAG
jgi:heptosyltransferase-2